MNYQNITQQFTRLSSTDIVRWSGAGFFVYDDDYYKIEQNLSDIELIQ